MIKRKDVPKKKKQAEVVLSPAESLELQMIVDRLAVQNPEGESFENYLESLKKMLKNREMLVAGLLDRLSRAPTNVGFRTFVALEDLVTEKQLARVNRQTAYRFAQKGFQELDDTPVPDKVVLVPKETKNAVAHRVLAPGAMWFFAALVPDADYASSAMITALLDPGTREPFVRVSEGSGRTYRKFVEGFAERAGGFKLCEVPIEHAALLFSNILKYRKGNTATSEIDDVSRLLRPYLNREGASRLSGLVADTEGMPKIEDVKLEQVVARDDWPWILFSQEEMTPYKQRLLDIESAVLVVSPGIKEERIRDLIRRAAGELCDARKVDFLGSVFEERALVAKRCRSTGDAAMARAVAVHLRTLENPAESPFIQDIVTVSLAAYWPDELADAEPREERDPYQETPSGLIIPR